MKKLTPILAALAFWKTAPQAGRLLRHFGLGCAVAFVLLASSGCILFMCAHPAHRGEAQARKDYEKRIVQFRVATNRFESGYSKHHVKYLVDECVSEAFGRRGIPTVTVNTRSVSEVQALDGYNQWMLIHLKEGSRVDYVSAIREATECRNKLRRPVP